MACFILLKFKFFRLMLGVAYDSGSNHCHNHKESPAEIAKTFICAAFGHRQHFRGPPGCIIFALSRM